jgi:hypothetical protein
MEDVPMMLPVPPAGVETPAQRRTWIADRKLDLLRSQHGDALDVDSVSDAEMIDAIYYSVFPNWSPWGCFNDLFYRFRPNGDDPNSCIFEVMRFPPAPDPANRPRPAAVRHLGVDDDWTLAPELGPTLKVFQQDSLNLPHVQTGLKAQEGQEVIFASYNETKIRHFYLNLFRWMGIDDPFAWFADRR